MRVAAGVLWACVLALVAVSAWGMGVGMAQADGAHVREPAKLEVSRNVIDRGDGRLDVLAPITKRASGEVQVELHAAGDRYRFEASVDSEEGYVRFRKQIPRTQARLGTGIVTITYPGNERTRGQQVRLRAARSRAQLDAQRPELAVTGGQLRLQSEGELSERARGVVRVQLDWVDASGANRSHETNARIDDGEWELSEALPGEVRVSIEGRRSTVHSYTLFTGYARASMRGEMAAYQVLPAPAFPAPPSASAPPDGPDPGAPAPAPTPSLPPAPAPVDELPREPPAPRPLPVHRTSGYVAQQVPAEEQPFQRTRVGLDDARYPVDEHGVRIFIVEGENHPHPTVLETYALAMLNGHRRTGDPAYLQRAVANAQRLLDVAQSSRDGLYLTYTFAFNLFGDPAERLEAGWRSGMAQGRALIMLHRLHEQTGDPRWREAADRIYATTFHPRDPDHPWMAFVDDDGFLWFEEYPDTEVPPRVLNGHIEATIGYWKRALATGDPEAARLFDAGATTALRYAEVLRVPGGWSAYSVRTRYRDAGYHAMHSRELADLELLTGDPAFGAMHELYVADGEAAAAGG